MHTLCNHVWADWQFASAEVWGLLYKSLKHSHYKIYGDDEYWINNCDSDVEKAMTEWEDGCICDDDDYSEYDADDDDYSKVISVMMII